MEKALLILLDTYGWGYGLVYVDFCGTFTSLILFFMKGSISYIMQIQCHQFYSVIGHIKQICGFFSFFGWNNAHQIWHQLCITQQLILCKSVKFLEKKITFNKIELANRYMFKQKEKLYFIQKYVLKTVIHPVNIFVKQRKNTISCRINRNVPFYLDIIDYVMAVEMAYPKNGRLASVELLL